MKWKKHVTLFLNGWKLINYVYLDEMDEMDGGKNT
jgi:hypothetical protein